MPIFVHPTSDKSHTNLHIVMAEPDDLTHVTLCGIIPNKEAWDAHMLDPLNIENPAYDQMCKTCASIAMANY